MATQAQLSFLSEAARQAKASGHIFPAMAACEAALESSWGMSQLALQANNLFGQKQSVDKPQFSTLALPTSEFLRGEWVTVNAEWVRFPSQAASFAARMDLLHRLASEYPDYGAALLAPSPQSYVILVSHRWSTDPGRAEKCVEIYTAHLEMLTAAVA